MVTFSSCISFVICFISTFFLTTLFSISAICVSSLLCVSLKTETGLAGAGLFNAPWMSSRLAKMRSSVVGTGIFTWVGNQLIVSQMRSALVSHTQTV